MAINPIAPNVSDSSTIIDTTNTNVLLLLLCDALGVNPNQLPDDLLTTVVGNESL